MRQIWIAASGLLLSLSVAAIPQLRTATTNVDCNAGAAIGSVVATARPGDVVLVQGTCRENLVIQSEVQRSDRNCVVVPQHPTIATVEVG